MTQFIFECWQDWVGTGDLLEFALRLHWVVLNACRFPFIRYGWQFARTWYNLFLLYKSCVPIVTHRTNVAEPWSSGHNWCSHVKDSRWLVRKSRKHLTFGNLLLVHDSDPKCSPLHPQWRRINNIPCIDCHPILINSDQVVMWDQIWQVNFSPILTIHHVISWIFNELIERIT